MKVDLKDAYFTPFPIHPHHKTRVATSSFWSLVCLMDFHQGDEAFDNTGEVMGHQDNSLHQQHAYSGLGPKRRRHSTWKWFCFFVIANPEK